jgi:hypothetical protein
MQPIIYLLFLGDLRVREAISISVRMDAGMDSSGVFVRDVKGGIRAGVRNVDVYFLDIYAMRPLRLIHVHNSMTVMIMMDASNTELLPCLLCYTCGK